MSRSWLQANRVSQGTWTTSLLAGTGIFLCYALADTLSDGLIPC